MREPLSKAIYEACMTVNNHADLIAVARRLAKDYSNIADDDHFPWFHEIRMVLEGAELLMRDHADALDILSTKVGAAREAAQ